MDTFKHTKLSGNLILGKGTNWSFPQYKSKLIIHTGYEIYLESKMPNWFNRLMQRIFLGWKWEKIA